MSIQFFPTSPLQRVLLQTPGIAGTTPLIGVSEQPSWRVQFPRFEVPVFEAGVNDAAANDQGYFPVAAVYLEACGLRVSPFDGGQSFVGDGLARCSVWLDQVEVLGVPPPSLGADIGLDFQIRAAAANVPMRLVEETVLVKYDAGSPQWPRRPKGLLAMVSGILCTQFEVWMAVDAETTQARPLSVRVQMIVDRLAGDPSVVLGDIVEGAGLLPVANPEPP